MFESVNSMLPLHYAAAWHNTLNEESPRNGQFAVVEYLLQSIPGSRKTGDDSGRLPLHIAIEANAPLTVVEALLRVNPAAGGAVWRCYSMTTTTTTTTVTTTTTTTMSC
jgi:ankyrin repeat protein